MLSAMERLPSTMTRLVSWVTSVDPYFASAGVRRCPGEPLRGMSALLLHAVARPGLLPVAHGGGIQRAADHLVTDTRQVLHTTAAHEHDGVLLQVVAFAGDVGRDLDARGQTHTADLAKRRVRLLRCGRVDARADPTALGGAF